jgi:hypothetical protein
MTVLGGSALRLRCLAARASRSFSLLTAIQSCTMTTGPSQHGLTFKRSRSLCDLGHGVLVNLPRRRRPS